jgi:hypothetical protein
MLGREKKREHSQSGKIEKLKASSQKKERPFSRVGFRLREPEKRT